MHGPDIVPRSLRVALLSVLLGWSPTAVADEGRWPAPFGGTFNASFTFATDYSFAGISQTKLGPAYQAGLDWRGPDMLETFPAWLYATVWGSNVDFPQVGPGVEVDVGAGVKARLANRKLGLDVGYIRYNFIGPPQDLQFNYGDFTLTASYDFGFLSVSGRVRFSPNSFGASGQSWNKRGLVSVPLPIGLSDNVRLKVYGALGNINVERFDVYGLPSPDYWYWQVATVVSAYGLDVSVAYTDTSIEPSGCGYTSYCSGRVFMSVTKAF